MGGMDWIDQAQERDGWQALANEPAGSVKCGELTS